MTGADAGRHAGRAAEALDAQRAKRLELEEQLAREIQDLRDRLDAGRMEFDTLRIPPRKADITVHRLALAWYSGPLPS